MRDLATVARLPRMRLENTEPLSGDRLDTARRHRRIKAEGRNARCGAEDRAAEEGESGHLQLGDSREIGKGTGAFDAFFVLVNDGVNRQKSLRARVCTLRFQLRDDTIFGTTQTDAHTLPA